MRPYEQTHPWISFRLDTTRAAMDLWLLLGEATSKCDHISDSPLKPEDARRMLQVFLAKGLLATTAIEGNTLTEDDAIKAVEGTLQLPPSQEYLGREIENVLTAYNGIKNLLLADELSRTLSPSDVAAYNSVILRGLQLGEDVVPGEIRRHSVVVGSYKAAPAEDCEYLLGQLCNWLNGEAFQAPDDHPDRRVPLAVLKAVMAHLYIAWIHPFGDGNGRTARMLEVQILLEAGVPAPAAHLLSNHYNMTRSEYYRQLDRASKTGDPIPFAMYAVRGLVDGLRNQLSIIRERQFDDRWEQYVYESFGQLKSATDQRRLRLVLDLSTSPTPVARSQLRRLSPRLAEDYANKTDKTLSRDINAVVELGLVAKTAEGYVPQRHVILGFMPERVDSVPRLSPRGSSSGEVAR